jgi:hypothetical protein
MILGKGENRESDQTALNVIKAKLGLGGTTRGSPSLVNGVRLRTSSLRGSRVRIPPPAHHWKGAGSRYLQT